MIKLFGINFFTESCDNLSAKINGYLNSDEKVQIVKANTEFLRRANCEPKFREILEKADLVIADGRGVLWAARFLTLRISKNPIIRFFQGIGQMVYTGASLVFNPRYCETPISENIPGLEAMWIMIKEAAKTDSEVFFFGATEEDLQAAMAKIKAQLPEIKIAGYLNGYDFQKDSGIDPVVIINKTEAKLLIVALGSPMQEYWIRENLPKLEKVRVAVGEGGSLAFLAGSLKRAPKIFQGLGLEWLWRLFANRSLTHQTGSRLKRIWNAVPLFIIDTVSYKLMNGQINEKPKN